MPNPENLIGHGFDQKPERINKTGANKGHKWLSTLLREKLEEGDNAAKLVNKLVELANEKGDLNAIKEVIDRLEGKAKQEISHEISQGFINLDPLDPGNDSTPKDSQP